MCRVLRAALLTLMLLPPLAPAALGCTADADCDNSDTCSQPDHCPPFRGPVTVMLFYKPQNTDGIRERPGVIRDCTVSRAQAACREF